MAVYKIPQDVEADDKFVGPLSFKQFIYCGIAAIAVYLSVLSIRGGFWLALILFIPIITVAGFLGFPWGRDQPTEIWLAARIRFFIKPRRRIWNQSGIKDLVTVTAPRHIEKNYTNGLNQTEVSSRLTGLADLLDSRGWAVKNVNVNLYSTPGVAAASQDTDDRLLNVSALPQEVVEVTANDDVLDERVSPTAQHFEEMIRQSEQKHREEIQHQLAAVRDTPITDPFGKQASTPTQNSADFWFLQKGGHDGQHQSPNQILEQIATPTQAEVPEAGFTTFQPPALVTPHSAAPLPTGSEAVVANQQVSPLDEQAILAKIHRVHDENANPFGHIKTIMPLGQTPVAPEPPAVPPNAPAPFQAVLQPATPALTTPQTPVTPPVNPAIMNLANNDDLNVATLARQAGKRKDDPASDGEVVISLR